jgi:hypothetical protein
MKIERVSFKKIKNINLYNLLNKKKIIIVDNCFSYEILLRARNEIINFFKFKEFRFNVSTNKKIYHRWDYNPKKAKFKRIMQSITFSLKDKKYFKNCISILNKGVVLKKNFIKNSLKNLKENRIKKFIFAPRASFYPCGGGYYQMHSDDWSGEKILDLIPLSVKGDDYLKGGFVVEYKRKKINLDDYIFPGSIILLDSKIKHGVSKIDPKVKKRKNIGRYSLLSVMEFMN